ncbi:MAG: HAD-IC family P-type ATPase [bacterium]|nr:HAD-IC family P-type ATPase [bacterium]
MLFTKEITKKSFWALTTSETLDLFETTRDGLLQEDVVEREALFGKNVIAQEKKIFGKLRILFDQIKSPLIFLLLVSGGIMVLVGHVTDALFIFIAALFNSTLGFYQENKAEEALAHLKSYIKERIRVIREGREIEISTDKLVPGDIIHITQGDRVPADARLIYINDINIDESILTGEALPVQKTLEPSNFQASIGDQKSMIFSGTLVVQGFGNAVVCRTGPETEIGRIAQLVKDKKQEETPLQKAITRFSINAGLILVGFTTAIFFIGILIGKEILDMFLTSVAIIVSAVPEGLPIALTVILSIGVQRLAKKNGIIRKLLAAETLGNTTVILTDKTGTLTQAKMKLSNIAITTDQKEITPEFAMKLGLLNTNVVIENPQDPHNTWNIIGRPLEVAMVQAASAMEIFVHAVKKEIAVLDYFPFNSVNKLSATTFTYKSKTYTCLFGAPEIILHTTTHTNEKNREKIAKNIDALAYSGQRVLGLALKELTTEEKGTRLATKKKFEGFDFIATIAFTDPIRDGVRDAIHRIEQVGIKTVIVTGDHRGTAEAIGRELGFSIHDENVITGSQLDAMSDEELQTMLPKLRIISRVSPEGKVKIAKAFQQAGEIVAMTGDGINDAPSLKQADIGIAMGSGTDVAKDVAELVLLDDNYQTIVAAIAEGRRTMENVRKVIIYLLSSIFDELVLVGGALIIGVPLPLTALQILWVNFFTDSFPAIALAFEDGVDHLLDKPRNLGKGIIDPEMRFLIFAIGAPSSFILLGLYLLFIWLGIDPALAGTFIFASFGTYSLFLVYAVRSLKKSILSYNPFSNPYLIIATSIGLILMVSALYVPFLQKILGTVPLSPLWLLGVVGIGVMNIVGIEFGKWVINRHK